MVKVKSRKRRVDIVLYIMLIPALVLVAIYAYGPLAGLMMAFQEYDFAVGMLKSPFIGLENFEFLFFKYPSFMQVIWNTINISLMKMVTRFAVPIIVALLLNEVRYTFVKKPIQTMIYLPYFISWVVISGILINILSPTDGIINTILVKLGFGSVFFLGDKNIFPITMVISDVWKEFGYGTIIYMAAFTGIDPSLYEAASIDRANRFQKIWYITLPGIVPIMVLVGTLSMGHLLNAGFDQIFNLYNPMVYSTGDILDTFTYRLGMKNAQYSLATAVGLIKSIVSMVLVSISYGIAYKAANYRIF